MITLKDLKELKAIIQQTITDDNLAETLIYNIENQRRKRENKYTEHPDFFKAFFEEKCLLEGNISKQRLYELYQQYRIEHNLYSMSKIQFCRIMKQQTGIKIYRPMVNGKRQWSYLGISEKLS